MSKKARLAKKLRRILKTNLRKSGIEKELDRIYMDLLFGGSCITVSENGKIRAPTEEDFERIKMTIEGKMIQEGIRVDEIPFEELKRKFGYE